MDILKKYKNPIIISLVIFLVLTISYGFLNIGLGNDYSVFVSDFKHQYMEFYRFYRENLFSNFDMFIYNQGLSLGNEMFGLYNYYLASPLNLILFLFPKSNVEAGVITIIYVKLILGGICFNKYLDKFKLSDMFKIAISLSYIFSGYFLFNLINPIWLDICYMLPLTIMGLDYLVKTGIKKWFVLSASYMIVVNFYIGFMLCLFSFLYLMYEYFLHKFDKEVFINYFISSVFIVSTSITTLYTSYVSMSMSKGFGGSLFEDFFKQLFTPFDFFSKFVIGSNGYSQISNGFPNVWLSSFIGVLFILMLFDSRVSNKLKALNLSILGVIYLIFSTNGLNKIFHGFSKPIWFLYRNSFIFIFLVIIMVCYYLSSNELSKYKGIKFSKIFIIIFGIAYSTLLMFSKITDPWQNIVSIIGFWIMLAVIYFVSIKGKSLFNIFILLGLISGITINSSITIMNPYKMFGVTSKKAFIEYNNEINEVEEILSKVGYSTNYRALKNYESTYQEGINFDFNEFKGFSSNLNRKTMNFLTNIGLDSSENHFKSTTRNSFIDNLFGNKYYIITKQEELPKKQSGISMVNFENYTFYDRYMLTYWDDVVNNRKIGETTYSNIYENPHTFQTFYTSNVNKNISDSFTKDSIHNQNLLFKELLNSDENIVNKQEISMTEELINIEKEDNHFRVTSDSGELTYTFNSDEDYIGHLDNNIIRLENISTIPINYNLYVNGIHYYSKVNYVSGYNKTIEPVKIKKGENIIKISYEITDKSKLKDLDNLFRFRYNPNIYKISDDIINNSFDEYNKENKVNVISNNSTKLSVKLSNNNKKVLRSTIPYDKNWKVFVSTDYGRKEIPVEELDSFIAVDIDGLKDGIIDFEYSIHNIKLIVLINTLSLIFVIFVLDRIKFKKD